VGACWCVVGQVKSREAICGSLPCTGGSATGLSATDAWRRAAAGDAGTPAPLGAGGRVNSVCRLADQWACCLNQIAPQPMSALGRWCSLIPGFGVKLSITFLAGSTVLSAVGSCPPHDGVRRRWWINVESAVALSSARQASSDLTTATVPAGTSFPACVAGTL
jgi:hypothetical protein